MGNKQTTEEENIKLHYKWFCESCKKRKIKVISYKQYKKEFLQQQKITKRPEEQERLRRISKVLKKTMRMLK